jgi:hypothetical protein
LTRVTVLSWPLMSSTAKRIVTKDGTEHVLVELSEFQALLDAANASRREAPDVKPILERLAQNLEADEPTIGLDEFLAEYDAVHRSG